MKTTQKKTSKLLVIGFFCIMMAFTLMLFSCGKTCPGDGACTISYGSYGRTCRSSDCQVKTWNTPLIPGQSIKCDCRTN